jgi:hypothetical protein
LFQKKVFLYGEKENFEEYSLILEFARLNFPILNNYLVEMHWPCPWATVYCKMDYCVFWVVMIASFGHEFRDYLWNLGWWRGQCWVRQCLLFLTLCCGKKYEVFVQFAANSIEWGFGSGAQDKLVFLNEDFPISVSRQKI